MRGARARHARHYGTVPNSAPLNPANFRGARRRRAARMSSLLSHVLLSQQSQFLHKVDELEGMVEDLAKEFRAAVAEDRKSTRLNSSHSQISYAVFCLKKK